MIKIWKRRVRLRAGPALCFTGIFPDSLCCPEHGAKVLLGGRALAVYGGIAWKKFINRVVSQ